MNSESRRILHIITGLGDGGAEAVLYRLIASTPQHQHHVVSLGGLGKYGPMLEAQGVAVTALELRPSLGLPGKLVSLWQLIRRFRPDAIQSHMYHADFVAGVVGRLARARRIVWCVHHANVHADFNKPTTLRVARLCAFLSRALPDRIVFVSQKGAEAHCAIGYDPRKVVLVTNGVDLAQFGPDSDARRVLRESLSVSASTPLIGHVASWHPRKDHATLVAGLGHLAASGQDFHAVLVGRDVDSGNEALTALIKEQGIADRVTLLGQRRDIPAVMNGLDLFVLSSRGEAFPCVLVEAIACGTPCVATDVGDCAAIVSEAGRSCPPEDPAALAEAVAAELQSSPHRSRDALHALAAERYSQARMVADYDAIWFPA